MTVIYYRKSDGAMLGSSTGLNLDILKEKESFGSDVGALVLDLKPNFKDKLVTVQNNQLVIVDDLILKVKKEKLNKDRADGMAELNKLGITEDQLKALFGG